MRRLPPHQLKTLNFFLEDLPENCSTNFLLTRNTSTILVDNPLNPKLLVVSYPSITPGMHFFCGKADRIVLIKRFLKTLTIPTDLVIPASMLPIINNYWPVRFSVPVLFLAGRQDEWQPQTNQNSNIRLLSTKDAPGLQHAFYDHSWLWEFFLTPESLLQEGQAAAAFVNGKIACVASTLALTERYCELGVATRPEFRGRGLAWQCCQLLSKIQYEENGRLPCWRTDFDNAASRKVALQLGLKDLESEEKYVFVSNYYHEGAYATVAP